MSKSQQTGEGLNLGVKCACSRQWALYRRCWRKPSRGSTSRSFLLIGLVTHFSWMMLLQISPLQILQDSLTYKTRWMPACLCCICTFVFAIFGLFPVTDVTSCWLFVDRWRENVETCNMETCNGWKWKWESKICHSVYKSVISNDEKNANEKRNSVRHTQQITKAVLFLL